MFDRHVLAMTRKWVVLLATGLSRRGIQADHVTWAGFLIGMLAAVFIVTGHFWLAMAAILANRLFDGLDGAIARLNGRTDRGAFLDITLDFVFYSSIPLAFGLHDPAANAIASAVLIFAFVGTGNSFLAFAIMAERRKLDNLRLPDKGFYYLGGLTEATETITLFMAMCLFPAWFPVLAFVFAGLCAITTASRIAAGIRSFD